MSQLPRSLPRRSVIIWAKARTQSATAAGSQPQVWSLCAPDASRRRANGSASVYRTLAAGRRMLVALDDAANAEQLKIKMAYLLL
ncbi:hypothetical protein GCM10017771_35870 [Streptomyces capitiformicae]|uniref:Uncharacterized protein n=1 Tax=Streptomyces capitiformicae TaxID=2014920 RepID=A0A919L9P6_9ACTN|nr:hypothetical protein GCM10017771_35870 [Streptomyces capitiformicae]